MDIEITEDEKLILTRLGLKLMPNGALCPNGCSDKILDKEVEECASLIQLAEEING